MTNSAKNRAESRTNAEISRNFRAYLTLSAFLLAGVISRAAALPLPPAEASAGVLLNQTTEALREREIRQELREEKKRDRKGIEAPEIKKMRDEGGNSFTFLLRELKITTSEVLGSAELDRIKKDYVGKNVTVGDLYEAVNRINALYAEKGYIVCRAFLPPQEIDGGVVSILLVEGKTADIAIEGNKTTKAGYILDRIDLVKGLVSNLGELNKSLLRFNGTNDIQTRIQLKAGKAFGTTDYLLTVTEPKHHQFVVFADNQGSESSGEYRAGVGYTNTSLFGFRDQFSLTGVWTGGTRSGGLSYSYPITRKGTRIGAHFSLNSVEIIKGDLKDVDVKGNSYSYGLNISHPFLVGEKWKIDGALEWARQKIKTDIMTYEWVNDDVTHYEASLTIKRYGTKSLWYMRHGLTHGSWKALSQTSKNYLKYELFSLWQRVFAKNKTLTLKVNGQWAFADYLPSSDQFYIGGAASVRGYAENLMGADSGISANVEYAIPLGKRAEIFAFVDGGLTHGKNAWDDNKIAGAGLGVKLTLPKGAQLSLSYGVPLIKEINNAKVDSGRLYFTAGYRF